MASLPLNIERRVFGKRSGFSNHPYRGWSADGHRYVIRRTLAGKGWVAESGTHDRACVSARTLRELGDKLARIDLRVNDHTSPR